MLGLETATFFIYFATIVILSLLISHKQKSDTDFVLGNRNLNFYLTALSAHASDMSNWLFMGYPALLFLNGLFSAWAAIGLILFMYLNWQFIAPKVRVFTEKCNNLTLNAYFESRFKDETGVIRVLSSIVSLVFFLFYISAGLVGLGFLVETLFGLNYFIGISIGLLIVIFYVYLGGYTTVAWIDVFQGFFLLGVILFLPIYFLFHIGGFTPVINQLHLQSLSTSLFPDFSFKTITQILLISFGWGLGYLGQPHIITKFMGIEKVSEIKKAKYLGISWQTLALAGATLLGLIGIYLFPEGLNNPELVILEMVKKSFIPFFSALVLCAILAATTNVMAAQILVVASSLAEDFYKRLINKKASHRRVLKISRHSVILIGIIAFIIAYFRISTIYNLVLYSWSGLGSAFGPLLLFSLYTKHLTKAGAIGAIITGAVVSAVWPLIGSHIPIEIPPMIPGFMFSTISLFALSYKTDTKGKK